MENNFKLLQPRNFSQIISDTFAFLKINFRAVALPVALLVVPFLVVYAVFFTNTITTFLASAFSGGNPFTNTDWLVKQSSHGLLYTLALILGTTFLYLVIMESFIAYENSETGVLTSADIFKGVKKDFWRLVAFFFAIILLFIPLCFLFGILIGVGIVAKAGPLMAIIGFIFAIALIYVVVPISFSPFIFIRERTGVLEAIRKSFVLIKGFWWQTLGIIIVIDLIMAFAAYALQIPTLIVLSAQGLHSNGDFSSFQFNPLYLIFNTIGSTGSILLRSIGYMAIILQYYNLLERKEGVDVMKQIEDISAPESPQV
jgi:hypothetical protein